MYSHLQPLNQCIITYKNVQIHAVSVCDRKSERQMPEVRALLNTVLLLVEYTCGTFHTVPMIYD